jgi:hypothetical protein
MPTAKNAHTSDVSAVRDGMKYTLQVAANLYRIDVDSDLVVEEQELIETRPNGATRIIKVPVGIHPHEIVSALFNASERPTTGVTTTEPYNRSASKSAYKIAVGAVVTVLFVGSLILIAQQLPDATQTSSTAQAIGTASTRSQGSPSQDTTTSVQDKTAVARASGNQSSSTNRSVSQPASDPSLAKLKALHPNAPTYLAHVPSMPAGPGISAAAKQFYTGKRFRVEPGVPALPGSFVIATDNPPQSNTD